MWRKNRRDEGQQILGDQAFADTLADEVELATLADKLEKGASRGRPHQLST